MDSELINNILNIASNVDLLLLGEIAGGLIVVGVAAKILTPKKNIYAKRPVTVNTKNLDYKTEDVQREFANLTIQTANLDNDNLFFSGAKKPKLENTTFDVDRPNSVLPRSSQIIEEAIIFDSLGRKVNASDCLKKAILQTEDEDEQKRIQFILDKYLESSETNILEQLVHNYKTLDIKKK